MKRPKDKFHHVLKKTSAYSLALAVIVITWGVYVLLLAYVTTGSTCHITAHNCAPILARATEYAPKALIWAFAAAVASTFILFGYFKKRKR